MNRSSRYGCSTLVTLSLLYLGGLDQLWAHGDLHERLGAITLKLATATNDATLFVQRGELYREHQDWRAAAADFEHAAQLDSALVRMDFFRARLRADQGDLAQAHQYLNRLLTTFTNDTEALVLRARVLSKLNDTTGAVADYSRAIQLSPEPQPELFLERAELFVAKGQVGEAVRGLDEGVLRLGNLLAFQTRALDLELGRTNYDGALRRVNAILRTVPRKESWLARQGDLLKLAGREPEAQQAWTAALVAIKALPERLRMTAEIVELRARIERLLK